jgi:hypothetical protein
VNASDDDRPAPAAGRTLTILIVGGYGTFGSRLVQLLEDEGRLRLIVAGRSLQRSASSRCERPQPSN